MTTRVIAFLLTLFITGVGQAEQQKLPMIGIGPALGWEDGSVGDFDASGPSMQLRLVGIINSYPILALGVDAKYSRLNIESTVARITADKTQYGAIFGMMIPLKAFGLQPKSAPDGAGPPIYIGYNFSDNLKFNNGVGDLKGTGWKAGLQFPLGTKAIFQAEYNKTTYDQNGATNLFGVGDIESDTVTLSLQFGIPFVYHD